MDISMADLFFGYELIIQPKFNARTFECYDSETKFKPEIIYFGPSIRQEPDARAAIGVPVLHGSEFGFGYAKPLYAYWSPKNLDQKITIVENADGTRTVRNTEHGITQDLYSANPRQLETIARQLTPLLRRYVTNKRIETTTPHPKYFILASSV